jgi:uncharacterized DUF497 family protein
MDEYFELNGITFIWNREKAGRNLAKHGVAFGQAAEIFFDPFVRVIDASPEEEARDAVIGMESFLCRSHPPWGMSDQNYICS